MNQQQNNNNNDDDDNDNNNHDEGDFPLNVNIVSDVSEEEDNTNEEQEEDHLETEEEEEEEEDGQEEEDSSRGDYPAPPELQMSEQEERWAWNLMKWMEEEDPNRAARCMGTSGKMPSHYEYSLHAIFTEGNKEKADQNIRALQRFRQKYNIQDTVEEGVRAFQDFFQLQPGVFLHVDATGSQGSLFVMDFSKFFPARARESSENMRIQMVFWYYLTQVFAPNFDVLRGGVRFLGEATGMSHRNMNVRLEQQLFQELVSHLPIKFNEHHVFNTNELVNSFMDLLKRFMPDEMKEKIDVGCRLDTHQIHVPTASPFLNAVLNVFLPPPPRLTLPQLFLQPNYNFAMQNAMTKVRTLLEERYHNEETFELFSP